MTDATWVFPVAGAHTIAHFHKTPKENLFLIKICVENKPAVGERWSSAGSCGPRQLRAISSNQVFSITWTKWIILTYW